MRIEATFTVIELRDDFGKWDEVCELMGWGDLVIGVDVRPREEVTLSEVQVSELGLGELRLVPAQDARWLDHLDGNPRNNELSNLALAEPKEQDR